MIVQLFVCVIYIAQFMYMERWLNHINPKPNT